MSVTSPATTQFDTPGPKAAGADAQSAAKTTPHNSIPGQGPVWLFSAPVDLAAFLGSAVVSLLLLAVGWWAGWLQQDTPEWTWFSAILLVDVAHVYATGFRVYFVPGEFARRPWVYGLSPLLGFLIGLAVYSESEVFFWRALAYLAVFHFVRQQYGWVALYRSRAQEQGTLGRVIDTSAIYLATVYPLVYWHAHLPRNFWWFLQGDFTGVPQILAQLLEPFYWLALTAYAVRSISNGLRYNFWNPGKDIVLATTAVCWYVGIVAINSDYAFTVTNVIIHGVPYLVLVYWYRFVRAPQTKASQQQQVESASAETITPQPSRWRKHGKALFLFLGVVWVLAYAEELLWDHSVWHERGWLFGGSWDLGAWHMFLVPLLAVPQVTHYVLDGFIWRRRSNPELQTLTESSVAHPISQPAE